MSVPLMHPALIAYNGYDSGLGNRVRVVLGCRALAESEDRSFRYVWPTGALFGPRFDELWDVSGRRMSRATSRVLARLYPYVDEKATEWLDDAKRRERIWQVRTGSPILLPPGVPGWQDGFRALTPVPEIAGRVRAIFDTELRGSRYVGVMVRAHTVSHKTTIQSSPVEWFIRRMQELREADPELRFYLSCDVPEVQERIMRTVPGCVAQSDKGPYNSVQAVRASIVDLYLLASSQYLLGPHFSSFIHLAEHLSGDELVLETSVNGADPARAVQTVVADPLRPHIRTSGLRS